MTRSKKSRKPGVGSSGALKDDTKKKLLAPVPKRPKNKSGKAPGSRQQEGLKNNKQSPTANKNNDPRIGSKTPIDLGKPATTTPVKVKKTKEQINPIAAVRPVQDNTESLLEQEIAAIEQDARLLKIIEKQESDFDLTEAEIDLFNELMERHAEITTKLGWDEEDGEEHSDEEVTEEDLWKKLDNGDLSDYK